MSTLTTLQGEDIKTYRQLRNLQNVSTSETDTIEYKALFNGEKCTIYRHWSNKELGFHIYKGDSVSECIAKIVTGSWLPYLDAAGKVITRKYPDGSDSGIYQYDSFLKFARCEN